MRHRPILLAAAAAACLAAPSPAAGAPAASVHVSGCQTGLKPAQRLATFHAQMRAVPGTARMAMRFQLVRRVDGQHVKHVSGDGLSAWHRSRAGVKTLGYSQTVNGLQPGALYRSVVQFRWYDASGHTIKSAKRLSGSCEENGDLPNLTIGAVKIAPGASSGTAMYSVAVTNSGKGTAKNFGVALIVDGGLADSTTVDQLDGGETKTVKLTGPVCHRLRAVVDREDAVPETIEEDNSLRSHC